MNVIRYYTMTTIKKLMVLLVVLSLISMWFLSYSVLPLKGEQDKSLHMRLPSSQSVLNTETKDGHISKQRPGKHSSDWDGDETRLLPSALVIIERSDSVFAFNITRALEANQIDFTAVLVKERHWPRLEHKQVGKYSIIIFQSIHLYLGMDKNLHQAIHQYCKKYSVGIVFFATVRKDDDAYTRQIGDLPVYMDQRLSLKDLVISPSAKDILYITKAGQLINDSLPYDDWTVFRTKHTSYRPIVQAKTLSQDLLKLNSPSAVLHTTMLLDEGNFDGIRRIFIGNDLRFWLHYILFLDGISYLSHGLLKKPLDRYIQVDIDDIFVGAKGIRMTSSDVEALVLQQQILAEKIPGFSFKLGFSGKFFKRGNEREMEGDEALVKNADKFSWFPHMWNHAQPHTFDNQTQLVNDMKKNSRFAKTHQIVVDESYAIAPHHSGVYPTQVILYNAWKQVWGIKVTSTEEYPALRPARKRKGFIFKEVMVLPRQTCGLFTHTIRMKDYPGGRERLDGSIQGGELFQTIVDNQINVYMTHMTNYGSDRLALYTFDKVVSFVQTWTNIRLLAEPPVKLAKRYFEIFPREKEPLWTNPCQDKRHLEIRPEKPRCTQLPNFLVIGPQKTGTTALHSFLSMHPKIFKNQPSEVTFEELQFFSSTRTYLQGVEWYMSFFPQINNSSSLLFEKSATYFDSANAPMRAYALLPKARLIVILTDPAQRAYSWYQHERAHTNPASMNYTFYDVISSGIELGEHVASLRNRCLDPGKYAQHLQKWLQYYPTNQLLVLDGDLLKADPVAAMFKVQRFLHMKKVMDFSNSIIYDAKKGFYCPVVYNGHTKCLGKGKGRSYPPMDSEAMKFLRQYYHSYNIQLEAYLTSISQSRPAWLNKALTEKNKLKSTH